MLRQSKVATAIRFPLIVLVLFQHSVGDDPSPMRWLRDGGNLVNFLPLTICLALYYLLKRIVPKPLAFACGGRITA